MLEYRTIFFIITVGNLLKLHFYCGRLDLKHIQFYAKCKLNVYAFIDLSIEFGDTTLSFYVYNVRMTIVISLICVVT